MRAINNIFGAGPSRKHCCCIVFCVEKSVGRLPGPTSPAVSPLRWMRSLEGQIILRVANEQSGPCNSSEDCSPDPRGSD